MHYDVAIIGAGMSGLAAGIRLAYYEKKVCILERHYAYGGLNSYYTLEGREYDVGLHALTNYVPPTIRNAPLNKLFRQLRLDREELDLCEQTFSEIRFPGHRLRFSNNIELLTQEVAETFPSQIDAFRRMLNDLRDYDDVRLDASPCSARRTLAGYFDDPVLVDMLLCGPMFYGCPQEHDMDWTHFVTMFKSLFFEGFCRPRAGVRAVIRALVRKFRVCGGKLCMRCGVERIETDGQRVTALRLDNAETVTAGMVLSSAGYHETLRLCGRENAVITNASKAVGRLTFVESITVTSKKPVDLGIPTAIIFFNDAETFTYATPDDLVDVRSGVICCPNNYERHEDMAEGFVRLTSLANYDRWAALSDEDYARAKQRCYDQIADRAMRFIPDFRPYRTGMDIFTPRTIQRFTGHDNGAVYGTPEKVRDGRTPWENLFICGTDQGFLGVVGAMLSGVTIANLHGLSD